MTAPSPDDLPGLIEAVAEVIIRDRAERMCWEPEVLDAVLNEPRVYGIREGFENDARAAVAAMVEHLGLTEETCCDDADEDTITCAELGEMGYVRLVSRWVPA